MQRRSHPILEIQDCWAKTNPETGTPCLSVADHCLTVGWVAKNLHSSLPPQIQSLLPNGWNTLIAAHDIGKITPGFQLKCPLWQHHTSVSAQILPNGLTTNHALISQWHLQDTAKHWTVSSAGHHGSYPEGWSTLKNSRFRPKISEGGLEHIFAPLRDELLATLTQVFGPLPTTPIAKYPPKPDDPVTDAARLHFLTGFTILADWIGSNTEWFPIDLTIDEPTVTSKAIEKTTQLRLSPTIKSSLTFGQQFTAKNPEAFTPRPIQQTLLDAATEPGLYIVEAPMGMGKTEAALATAYQLWEKGHARGLYFALPTQLTSNRIHERINAFLKNTIDADTFQTLIHGNAWLSEDATISLSNQLEEKDTHPELDHNDTDEALRWFSSTRKQLIAPFGTGTIDQALLSILPARFAALRHFALAGKVIVIDEVHSYDPYMSALIDRLIQYQLECGSTIIILSATLTAARRQQLVAAAGATESTAPHDYPLITKVATGNTTAEPFPVAEKVDEKSIKLHHHTLIDDDTAYWQSIADHVNAGANVVVIRNTVALAQQTYQTLKSLLRENSDQPASLIHSRFPQWKRETNESTWVERLGKNPAKRPKGSLLVSTQIVEQSVDIDADLLVTDLAPTDLILQRIGRLHRHQHDRPTEFTTPTCHILHPDTDWQGSAKEVKQQLYPHHFIYPPLTLWQAQQTLLNQKTISLPTQIRDLLENASAETPDDTSPALSEFLSEYQLLENQQSGTARIRDTFTTAIDDQEGRETRYKIQPSIAVILLKEPPLTQNDNITITPYQQGENAPSSFTIRPEQFSYPLAKSLHKNAVQISRYLAAELLKHQPTHYPWLPQHMRDAVIAVVQDDSTELDLLGTPNKYTLHYHPETGITSKKNEQSPSYTEPEEDWF
ncbi:MAG: CRISPR-associated helicase Cas3' [Akkermansiaceae bacterium]|nr:CRISPR-associated helicase Cas3' [Akkermansiaceae bacterium]